MQPKYHNTVYEKIFALHNSHALCRLGAALVMTGCEKVSLTSILIGGTGVEDRVKMSHQYYQIHKSELNMLFADDIISINF